MKTLTLLLVFLYPLSCLAAEAGTQTIKQQLRGVCTALEAYKVDYEGYPGALSALVPAYLPASSEDFLKGLRYEVREDHALPGLNPKAYKAFRLTWAGADQTLSTKDDVVIDTQRVAQQPKGFGFGVIGIGSGLSYAEPHPMP
jgi:hypothetical protein